MSFSYEQRIKHLHELSQLPRQSLCFQLLTIMNLCHLDLDNGKVERLILDDESCFYEANSLKEQLLNVPSLSNSHKVLYILLDAGFIERRVLDKDGQVVIGDNYQRNTAKIFWRMSTKGLSVFR
ncbi:hypothetical protein [Vibrio crassostreae]|uniref:hypothetical protein n=1 Tax=Vibrio crassostreae TaxID=246167 RepID=UPI001B312FE5|nr:hypothetical protein [Vibrio crassostreae]